jgi:hypothetical protein
MSLIAVKVWSRGEGAEPNRMFREPDSLSKPGNDFNRCLTFRSDTMSQEKKTFLKKVEDGLRNHPETVKQVRFLIRLVFLNLL